MTTSVTVYFREPNFMKQYLFKQNLYNRHVLTGHLLSMDAMHCTNIARNLFTYTNEPKVGLYRPQPTEISNLRNKNQHNCLCALSLFIHKSIYLKIVIAIYIVTVQ